MTGWMSSKHFKVIMIHSRPSLNESMPTVYWMTKTLPSSGPSGCTVGMPVFILVEIYLEHRYLFSQLEDLLADLMVENGITSASVPSNYQNVKFYLRSYGTTAVEANRINPYSERLDNAIQEFKVCPPWSFLLFPDA